MPPKKLIPLKWDLLSEGLSVVVGIWVVVGFYVVVGILVVVGFFVVVGLLVVVCFWVVVGLLVVVGFQVVVGLLVVVGLWVVVGFCVVVGLCLVVDFRVVVVGFILVENVWSSLNPGHFMAAEITSLWFENFIVLWTHLFPVRKKIESFLMARKYLLLCGIFFLVKLLYYSLDLLSYIT